MSVYAKLQEARIRLQSKELKKSGHNKFAGYYYFELADFLPVVNEIFAELKLCSIVSFGLELASLRIVDIEDGTELTITSPMAEAQLKGCHPIQQLGAVETYNRRYLYVTALEIVEHDAIDSSEPKKEEKPARLPALTDEEAAHEYTKWVQIKSLCVDEDGDPDQERQANEWGKLPSNVRTAIKKYGESLKTKEQ